MLYTGISRLVNINPGEIVPSEKEREEFIAAAVAGKPFHKECVIGPFRVVFTSPSAIDYTTLGAAPKEQYEACLIAATIKAITYNSDLIYSKSDNEDLKVALQKIQDALGSSVLVPRIIREWFIFITTFIKLLEETTKPDFFSSIQSGKQ